MTAAAAMSFASFEREAELHRRGAKLVCGIDEVGRGPLAGPVVAAAVVLDPARIPEGLADSKTLPKARREALYEEILASALVSVASVCAIEIDRSDIRKATLLAMVRACAGLSHIPCHVLVDGRDAPSFSCKADAVIGGDALIASIAAASIIAKVTRDRMMTRLAAAFPAYGFDTHVGYATAAHRNALDTHGPCAFHRYSFAPIKGRYMRG